MSRRKEIRDAVLALALPDVVRSVDRVLDAYVDQGRPAKAEGREVLREALEGLARHHLSDKVVFLDTGTFAVQRRDRVEEAELVLREARPATPPADADGADGDAGDDDALLGPQRSDYSGPIRIPDDLRRPSA